MRNHRDGPRRGVTLIECLIVTALLAILAMAHVRAMSHLRTMHALSAERESMVRDAHAIAEELRAGERDAPKIDVEVIIERESGTFALSGAATELSGVVAVSIAGRRSTPHGEIPVDLTVLLHSEGGDD